MNHDKIKIAQIFYDEKTKHMANASILFDGSKCDKYLENYTIARQITGLNPKLTTGEYIGILSARFEEKFLWKQSANTIAKAIYAIEEDGYAADVYSFFGSHTVRNIWMQADRWQPGIVSIAKRLFSLFEIKTGIEVGSVTQLETPVILQNAFIAKREVYFDYVNSWLVPLIEIMEKDEELRVMLMQDANYKDAKLSATKCKPVFGVDHYTFHPFVCERFFATYMAINSDLTLKHI